MEECQITAYSHSLQVIEVGTPLSTAAEDLRMTLAAL
jgi:hypothetical protein